MVVRTRQAIHPIHFSLHAILRKGGRIKPADMERQQMPCELSEGLTQIAIDIFTDCVNVGVPFQEALCAVYLSGLEHGHTITKEKS